MSRPRSLLGAALASGLALALTGQAHAQDPAEPAPEAEAAPEGEATPRLRLRPQPRLARPGAEVEELPAEAGQLRLQPPAILRTGAEELAVPDTLADDEEADQALEEALDEGFGEDELFGQDVAAEPTVAEEHAEEGAHEDAHAAADAHDGSDAHDGEAHGAGADHGAEHEHFDVVQFSATVLNFLIWLAIIIWLMRKPMTEYLRNRRREVEEGLVEAERLEKEAKQKHAEYSERLSHLDEELAKLRSEMVKAGEAEADRIIAEAEARAARMRKDAQFVIDQQMKQLRADLTREAIEAAVDAAERVLTEQTAIPDQERLAEGYLGHLSTAMKTATKEDAEARA